MDDDAKVPEIDGRLRGCLFVTTAIAILFVLGPPLVYYLYDRSATGSAEQLTLKIATVFADRVIADGSIGESSIRRIDDSVAEVSVFSLKRTSTTLVVSINASSGRETLFGVSPFVRCHTVSFAMIHSARPRYSIEPLPGCAYEVD
ncbi:hypothetical protein AB0G15_43200 [Streptosporangium sp. NPDC023825]|uniref:hypothetical protein n=1 Tax=Streptosporangium sp. NPDC023825 TaxID=3154909 RepID=UPI00341D97E0